MKLIYLILLIPLLVFGQSFERLAFTVGSDTISNYTKQDTLQWRVRFLSTTDGPAWNSVTSYIDSTEKKAETVLAFDLSNESGWTWGAFLQLRILSYSDTITSNLVPIGNTLGAVTVFVDPDTMGTQTIYTVHVGGR